MAELGWKLGGRSGVLHEEFPQIAIVAGSGLGILARRMELEATLDYRELPILVSETESSNVAGHSWQWAVGRIGGVPIHLLSGRRHYYEGINAARCEASIHLLKHAGVRRVILTNAAGGLSPRLLPGDFMLIRDLINLIPRSPSKRTSTRARSGKVICDSMQSLLLEAATAQGIALKEGVYAAVSGPYYETPGEVEMLRRLGADAVGMSTAPEAIAAARIGLKVAAISLITNSHVVKTESPTMHDEVIQMAGRAADRLAQLISAVIPQMQHDDTAGATDV